MTAADPPTAGLAAQIADLDATLARHQPDEHGRCAACVRVGLFYDRSPARHPCGAYDVALQERTRLLRPRVPQQRQPGRARSAA